MLKTTTLFMGALAVTTMMTGCARTRILDGLRLDERLRHRERLLTEQIEAVESRNAELAYEAEYMARRQQTSSREAVWWQTYGRSDLGRCIEAVNSLIEKIDGRVQGLYAAYYGAACRQRRQVEHGSALLIADLGHSITQPTMITAGMTFMAEPTQFSFAILRPAGGDASKRLHRIVWRTPQISTVGGQEQRWHFLESFNAQTGDIPAIVFPGVAGIYLDRLEVTTETGIGNVVVAPFRGQPEKETLITLPPAVNNRQYSFALMGVPTNSSDAR